MSIEAEFHSIINIAIGKKLTDDLVAQIRRDLIGLLDRSGLSRDMLFTERGNPVIGFDVKISESTPSRMDLSVIEYDPVRVARDFNSSRAFADLITRGGMSMPKFKHTHCDDCVFLGEFDGRDLYYCPQPAIQIPTVIARFGSAPGDYSSGEPFAKTDPWLGEAKSRALKAGLQFREMLPDPSFFKDEI